LNDKASFNGLMAIYISYVSLNNDINSRGRHLALGENLGGMAPLADK
jgi:hypothetical protein